MLQDVVRYLEYLEHTCGLMVSVHTPTANADPIIDSIAPFNIHRSDHCLSVKGSLPRHRQCLAHQQQVRSCCDRDMFCMQCPFGVREFIVPIRREGVFLGYIAAACDREEMAARTLLLPLAAMLSLVLEPSAREENNDLYQHILVLIHGNLHKKLTIEDIADQCFCSPSQVSHLFKSRSGMTVNYYITQQKMKRAQQLLSGGKSISETAALCGYTDTNYFISVFKRHFGLPPGRYQKSR